MIRSWIISLLKRMGFIHRTEFSQLISLAIGLQDRLDRLEGLPEFSKQPWRARK